MTLDAKAPCFATMKETKAICSHVTLDSKALCFSDGQRSLPAHACTIHEAEAAHSTAIRDAEIWRASQAKSLQREHGRIMWDLEA